MEKLIFRYYEYFYSRMSGFLNFDFTPTEKDKKIVENFLKLLQKEGYDLNGLGEDFFWKYFCFSFNYWFGKNTRNGLNKPMFSWIIGPENYKRWINKSEDYKYWYENNLLRFCDIKNSDIFTKNIIEMDQIASIEYMEREKERFYNEDKGIMNCLAFTNLYDINSNLCLGCINNISCKTIKYSEEGIYGKVQ